MGPNPEEKETERYKGIITKLNYLALTVTKPFSCADAFERRDNTSV